ncbi:hypothetical protein EDD17DRAFT_1650979 [Pisolithus thermaeus]|nr:hypothetical protein EDD17DRAFT_1650979 [Pisolithus thermaeus]
MLRSLPGRKRVLFLWMMTQASDGYQYLVEVTAAGHERQRPPKLILLVQRQHSDGEAMAVSNSGGVLVLNGQKQRSKSTRKAHAPRGTYHIVG